MLSHSDLIIPGIGAVTIDIVLHTFNIIEGFNEVLEKAVDWLGRPHPIFEYLYPVFVWPLQVLASVFEGLDVAFDKSKSLRFLSFLFISIVDFLFDFLFIIIQL